MTVFILLIHFDQEYANTIVSNDLLRLPCRPCTECHQQTRPPRLGEAMERDGIVREVDLSAVPSSAQEQN